MVVRTLNLFIAWHLADKEGIVLTIWRLVLSWWRIQNKSEMVSWITMKSYIPVVVGDAQSAFSGGKNIQDGILIANEVLES